MRSRGGARGYSPAWSILSSVPDKARATMHTNHLSNFLYFTFFFLFHQLQFVMFLFEFSLK